MGTAYSPKPSKQPGFAVLLNKGFHITFENGMTASVQFGSTNYCGDYPDAALGTGYGNEAKKNKHFSPDAEVAAWGPKGWITKQVIPGLEDDDVKGWMNPAEVLAFLKAVAALPSES